MNGRDNEATLEVATLKFDVHAGLRATFVSGGSDKAQCAQLDS